MKIIKTIICGLLLTSVGTVLAQGGKDVKGLPPEVLAKYDNAGMLRKQARLLLKQGKTEEAISLLREAVAIYDTVSRFTSGGNYELAKALTIAGRKTEALATYKKAVRWESERNDFHVNGPPSARVLMDYAILLVRSGKEDEAKSVYYSALRQYNALGDGNFLRLPFLVVFAPDPFMTTWDFTPEKLVSAATMAKMLSGDSDTKVLAETVRRWEPNWLIPYFYTAVKSSNEDRDAMLAAAVGFDITAEERGWLLEYLEAVAIDEQNMRMQRLKEISDRLAKFGLESRKASTVLNAAKLELERNHHRIAVCNCAGGHG